MRPEKGKFEIGVQNLGEIETWWYGRAEPGEWAGWGAGG